MIDHVLSASDNDVVIGTSACERRSPHSRGRSNQNFAENAASLSSFSPPSPVISPMNHRLGAMNRLPIPGRQHRPLRFFSNNVQFDLDNSLSDESCSFLQRVQNSRLSRHHWFSISKSWLLCGILALFGATALVHCFLLIQSVQLQIGEIQRNEDDAFRHRSASTKDWPTELDSSPPHYRNVAAQDRSLGRNQYLQIEQRRYAFASQPILIAPTPLYGSCAILLYGLPRSFKTLVLPSIQRHVIRPNLLYQCDYFVHFYNVTSEPEGRSSIGGGTIQPADIFLLSDAMQHEIETYNTFTATPLVLPKVQYMGETDEDFIARRGELVIHYTTATHANNSNQSLYIPRREAPTVVENIIKMWHSQNSVWDLAMTNQSHHYDRVAMLRSDVIFLTPIDVWSSGKRRAPSSMSIDTTDHTNDLFALSPFIPDVNNTQVVIPAFAAQPVNDRAIIGPADAVKIWATGRWERIESHVRNVVPRRAKGYGMGSEYFLAYTLFPAILDELPNITAIVEDDQWCFARARVQSFVWLLDCVDTFSLGKNITEEMAMETTRHIVENIIRRPCSDLLTFHGTKKYGRRQIQCDNSTAPG